MRFTFPLSLARVPAARRPRKTTERQLQRKNVSRSSHLVFTDNGWTISISAPATVVKIILDGTTSAALWDRCGDRRKWYRTVRSR